MDDQKKRELKKILKGAGELAIYMHINPDPDSMASALILQRIASFFSLRSTILISGKLGRRENQLMAKSLGIPLVDHSKFSLSQHGIRALVDCQPHMTNNPFKENEHVHVVIDHHVHRQVTPPPKPSLTSSKASKAMQENITEQKSFWCLEPKAATTASILMDFLLSLTSKKTVATVIHENIATAYAYSLLAETHYLTREYADSDIELYKKITPYINFKKLAYIRNVKRSKDYYSMLKKGLRSYKIQKKVLYCALGQQNSAHLLHLVAENFACMEGVEAAVVSMKKSGEMGRISLRAQKSSANLGIKLRKALAPLGSGGGHFTAAAGVFHQNVSEKKVLAAVVAALVRK